MWIYRRLATKIFFYLPFATIQQPQWSDILFSMAAEATMGTAISVIKGLIVRPFSFLQNNRIQCPENRKPYHLQKKKFFFVCPGFFIVLKRFPTAFDLRFPNNRWFYSFSRHLIKSLLGVFALCYFSVFFDGKKECALCESGVRNKVNRGVKPN